MLFLRRLFVCYALVLVGAIGLSAWTGAAPAFAHPSADHVLAHARQALFDATNAARVRHGLGPLASDPTLEPVAAMRAASQLGPAPLSHRDESGQLIFAGLLAEHGIQCELAGENLARVSSLAAAPPEAVAEALLASPKHRKNILEPAFTRLAIGAASNPDGRVVFAQIFASRQWAVGSGQRDEATDH
jgi:uncharacterized protein YkwD